MVLRSVAPETPLPDDPWYPTQTVHEHEHALGAEMAQVHLAGTRRNAPAVRREAEVAAAVETGVERRAGHREPPEHVAQRSEPGPVSVPRVEVEDGLACIQGMLTNPRTGHDDFLVDRRYVDPPSRPWASKAPASQRSGGDQGPRVALKRAVRVRHPVVKRIVGSADESKPFARSDGDLPLSGYSHTSGVGLGRDREVF